MKIIGRASAVNLELDAGGIVNVFTTAAIAVPFDQTNVEVVDNDGHHKYLIELAEVTSYTPEGGVETVFSGTRDQLIDILNEQFFTGGTGAGGGFTPTTDVLQSQIVRFSADTVADAQALTFVEGERIHIADLDEEYCAKNISISAPSDLSGGMISVGDRVWAVTHDDGTYGHGTLISFKDNAQSFRTEYIFNGATDSVIKPTGTIAYNNNTLYMFFLEGGANNRGGVGKFDIVTKTFTKLADLSDALGYDTFAGASYREMADPVLFNGAVYESLAAGGAGGHGAIVKLDLTTETLSSVYDYLDSNLQYTRSIASGVHDGLLYIARNKNFFSIDTNDTVSLLCTFASTARLNGNIIKVGDVLHAPYWSNNAFITLTYDTVTTAVALYNGNPPNTDITTNTIGILNLFTYNGEHYGVGGDLSISGSDLEFLIFKHDFQGGAFTDVLRIYDSGNEQPKGMLFNNNGSGELRWLDYNNDIKKIDLATSTVTPLYNLSEVIATVDNITVIDINQAPLYLQVLDDHLKSISTVNGLATITSARGVESTFNYSSGFIDYNDSSAAITLVANTWTDVPNDGAGAFSNDTYRPNGVNDILNTTTGYLDFSQLGLGDEVFLRIDFNVTPNLNNAFLECRMELGGGASVYQLDVFSKRLDNGAGVSYPSEKGAFYVYMGDGNTLSNPGKLQVRLSSGGSLDNAGVAISIIKK